MAMMSGSVPAAAVAKTVVIPKLVGQTESRAQCALKAVGLRWRYRGDNQVRSRPLGSCTGHGAVIPDPKVISQAPRAGTRVHSRSVVVLDDECLRHGRHHGLPCA